MGHEQENKIPKGFGHGRAQPMPAQCQNSQQSLKLDKQHISKMELDLDSLVNLMAS